MSHFQDYAKLHDTMSDIVDHNTGRQNALKQLLDSKAISKDEHTSLCTGIAAFTINEKKCTIDIASLLSSLPKESRPDAIAIFLEKAEKVKSEQPIAPTEGPSVAGELRHSRLLQQPTHKWLAHWESISAQHENYLELTTEDGIKEFVQRAEMGMADQHECLMSFFVFFSSGSEPVKFLTFLMTRVSTWDQRFNHYNFWMIYRTKGKAGLDEWGPLIQDINFPLFPILADSSATGYSPEAKKVFDKINSKTNAELRAYQAQFSASGKPKGGSSKGLSLSCFTKNPVAPTKPSGGEFWLPVQNGAVDVGIIDDHAATLHDRIAKLEKKDSQTRRNNNNNNSDGNGGRNNGGGNNGNGGGNRRRNGYNNGGGYNGGGSNGYNGGGNNYNNNSGIANRNNQQQGNGQFQPNNNRPSQNNRPSGGNVPFMQGNGDQQNCTTDQTMTDQYGNPIQPGNGNF